MANSYVSGQQDTRPWGTWRVIDCGNNFCVKHIMVNSGGILSLQLHHHRDEYWIIIKGCATITLGDKQFEKKAGESVFIPTETKHRIQNDSNEPVEFIEVQTGEPDEADIVRFEDKYGRAD